MRFKGARRKTRRAPANLILCRHSIGPPLNLGFNRDRSQIAIIDKPDRRDPSPELSLILPLRLAKLAARNGCGTENGPVVAPRRAVVVMRKLRDIDSGAGSG